MCPSGRLAVAVNILLALRRAKTVLLTKRALGIKGTRKIQRYVTIDFSVLKNNNNMKQFSQLIIGMLNAVNRK